MKPSTTPSRNSLIHHRDVVRSLSLPTLHLLLWTSLQTLTLTISLAWLFELAGGAVADFSNTTCIPQSQREAHFTVAALHQWDMGHDDPECQITADNVRTLHSVPF
jgi:hypothetical protein